MTKPLNLQNQPSQKIITMKNDLPTNERQDDRASNERQDDLASNQRREDQPTSQIIENTPPAPRKNIWNLVLGIAFIGYGSYRVYTLSSDIESNVLGFVLGIGFIAFGIYDLWKYNKGI